MLSWPQRNYLQPIKALLNQGISPFHRIHFLCAVDYL